MTKRIDMTGETYGWLKVLGPSDIKTSSGELKWKCEWLAFNFGIYCVFMAYSYR